MRIKSYFVKSTGEALAQARAELGEDALLLSTRKVDSPLGSSANYEVVFGCPGAGDATDSPDAQEAKANVEAQREPERATAEAAAAVAPVALKSVAGRPRMSSKTPAADLEQLRSQMDEIHGLLLSAGRPRVTARGLPFLDTAFARLTKAGLSVSLAGSIVDGVAAALASGEPEANESEFAGPSFRRYEQDRLSELLRTEMNKRIKIDSQLGVKGSGCAVVAMVGPTGAGKTSTLMKIAAFQAARNRPVRLLSLDHSGLGSRMQLQFFARKTGVAFTAVETPEVLPQLIDEERTKSIVLIDTPGHQPDAEREKLGSILARCSGVNVHLVLPGYMSSGACREAVRKYGIFWPAKLAVTKLDETTSFGTLASEAARAGLSLSLVADGVSIPDSLHSASVEDFIAIAVPEQAQQACA